MMASAATMELKIGKGYRLKQKDVFTINRELARIENKHGGHYKAEDVVDAVRPWDTASTHPLRPFFTTNKSKAMRKCWVAEARYLIQAVRVVVTPSKGGPSCYVRAVSITPLGYATTVKVMSTPNGRATLLAAARRDLEIWYSRYQDLTELSDSIAAVRQAIDTFPSL